MLSVSGTPRSRSAARSARRAGLALALLGIRSAPAVARGETPDDDRGDDVHGECEPVAPFGKSERVQRREEEEVEREHARDGDRDGEERPPEDRDGEDCEEIEDAEAQHGHHAVEELDGDRHGGDQARTGHDPDHPLARRLRPVSLHSTRSVRLRPECRATGLQPLLGLLRERPRRRAGAVLGRSRDRAISVTATAARKAPISASTSSARS